MTGVVLDASVVVKWFAPEQSGSEEARGLRAAYEAGRLAVAVPSLLFVELLNIAGRRWGWSERALLDLASALNELGFESVEPDLTSVASWVARGLTPYDAVYVALAEERGERLVSDDRKIAAVGGPLVQPLVQNA